jgi:hypothetical protein
MNVSVHNLNKIKSGPYNAAGSGGVFKRNGNLILPARLNSSEPLTMKQLLQRKSPVEVVEKQRMMPSLLTCLLLDAIGSAVILIPVAGEIIWAPISAFLYWRMFGFRKGFFGGIFSFVEELIPGLDFIPTFTISWLVLYFKRNKQAVALRPFTR